MMAFATFGQTAWLFGVAAKSWFKIPDLSLLLLCESAHYVLWLLAINWTTEKYCRTRLPAVFKLTVYIACAAGIGSAIYNSATNAFENYEEDLIIWQGIFFPILSLLSIEQLYRNNTQYRFFKLLCLGLAIVYVFDAYLFTQHLIFLKLDSDLWQARAAVSMASSLLMILGVATMTQPSQQSARLTFSRPIIFYTTSLTLAGALLTALSLSGYYVRLYGGNWGTVIYALIAAGGLLFIGFVFSSSKLKRKLSVLINKHLFSYKYDYRTEWLRLINQLAQPTSPTDTATRTIDVAANLFNCDGGALWLKRSKVLVPVRQINTSFDISEAFEPESSKFSRALKNEWVFAPNNSYHNDITHSNQNLPKWMTNIKHAWLAFPLLTEDDLVGFMVLTDKKGDLHISWEDLDLSKTVGRQIASYLARHEQAELLAESRQFDAFNKLSAFVMHDLKNLIAQQSLVVKNAEKHKDNPAFVEDAIHTIKNSVERMNNLLRKLQRSEAEEIKVLDLKEVFIETIKRCQKRQPAPTLVPFGREIKVKADFDSLVMVFTHIIQNAQDATSNHGFVDITTTVEQGTVMVSIEDNGIGMDEEFIHTKLFKPFETTKSGKGMGVGVYQAREHIQSIGGNINVESSPGDGTTFILTLPAC